MSQTQFREYRERDRVLRKIGYANYQTYLRSPLWASIRKRVLERDGYRCRNCKRPATSAHHKRYHHCELTGYTIKRIIAVCSGCHRRLEFDSGNKNGLREANQKFNQSMFERMKYAVAKQQEEEVLCSGGEWPWLKHDDD